MVSALESGFSSWIKEGSSFEDFLKAAADTHTNAMIDAFVGGIFEGMSNGVDGWMDKLFFGTGEMLNKLGNSISGGDTASPDTSSFEDYTIDVETTSEDLDKMTAESLKISSNSEFLLSGILKNTGIMAGTAAEGALDKGPDVDFKESSLSGDSFQYNSVYERTGVGDLSYTPDLKFGEDGRMLESGSGSLDSYFSSYEYDPSLPASDELNLGIPKGADLGFDDVTLGDSLDATYATSDDIITSLDNNSESTGNIFREGWNALGRIDAQGFMSIGIGLTSIAAMLGGGSSGSKLSQGLAIASFAVGAYKAFSPASVDPDILEQPGELNYSPVKTTDPYAFLNKASGGLIRGPGTYTSDSIPAMLSNEEFVINARDSIANRELLNHINAGGDPAKFIDVQKFSTGGLASNDPVHDISTSNVVKMRDIRTSDFSKDVSKDVVKVQDTSINNVLEMKDIRTSDFVKDASKDVAEWLYSSPVSYASVRSDSARMHNDIVESVSHKNAAKFANGGYVKGAGTAKSDSIPAWLSNREFVVNAEATKKNLPILQQINEGRDVPRFATGGLVGNPTSSSTASVLSQATNNYGGSDNSRRSEAVFNIEITGDVSKQTRAEIQRMIPQLAAGINAHNYEQGIK
jgi:hypothetical protein